MKVDPDLGGGLEIIDEPVKVSGKSTGRRSDDIDYEIFGTDMQFGEVELDPGETVVAEAGGMMYMDGRHRDGDDLRRRLASRSRASWAALIGAGKRLLTGESLFMTAFHNAGPARSARSPSPRPIPARSSRSTSPSSAAS